MSASCPHNIFLSLFAMNQRYGCLRCMEFLAIIRMKMIVSAVQSIDIFFSLRQVKNQLLALCLHRHVTFLFWTVSWKQLTLVEYIYSFFLQNSFNFCTGYPSLYLKLDLYSGNVRFVLGYKCSVFSDSISFYQWEPPLCLRALVYIYNK